MSRDDHVYAPPRTVTDLNDCYFYHTMDVPGVGRVTGEWDLRSASLIAAPAVGVSGPLP